MGDESTSTGPGGWIARRQGAAAAQAQLGFVLAWSPVEAARTGEWAKIPRGKSIFGRGSGEPGETRIGFAPSRPGATTKASPLTSRGLSRQQIVLHADGAAVEAVHAGRAPMHVNGRRTDRASLRAGDVVMIEGECVLLVAARDLRLFGGGAAASFPFGQPDEHGLVGESPASFQLRDQLAFVAAREEHVLVSGPSGAGKEVCARAIHVRSSRARGPFVARNAATIPAGLIDAELFGNAKNYPNAGMRERRGLIGEADGGTLFLDEIGELPTELQAHLLRLLDAGEYHCLGEDRPRKANVRLLTATNRSPETLKHDLLARLALRIEVPGLDDRIEDIPLLVRHLVRKLATGALRARFFEGDEPRIAPELVVDLLMHTYTTHVRELHGLLLVAMADSTEDFLDTSPRLRERIVERTAPAELTDDAIREALAREGGNVSAAWKALGMSSRDALKRLLKKRGIKAR
ncbi:MAG: sigma 54-interacting transcriptional regulator [Labilithrix sp.]